MCCPTYRQASPIGTAFNGMRKSPHAIEQPFEQLYDPNLDGCDTPMIAAVLDCRIDKFNSGKRMRKEQSLPRDSQVRN